MLTKAKRFFCLHRSSVRNAQESLGATKCSASSLTDVCLYLQQEDVSVQLEALDILGDLLSRFGGG